ncbi:MAG: acyl-CoA dehydratase activase-related protein [Candidatus Pararuminococcus gallinarum]|jgi:predicted CoA-substrate-specific enzyme activase
MGFTVGVDVGSTTVKVVVYDGEKLKFKHYERHLSQVRQKTAEILEQVRPLLEGHEFKAAISGSAGLGLSKAAGVDFVQEVFATGEAVKKYASDTDVVIELGGEDAKIIFFTGGMEERMNGTCAGGTGAFIDQMASLLAVTPDELDKLSENYEKIYPIASRCGVFAKSDIQPLLNQGARKEDIAVSIFQAVVDQTITGLAQGRQIKGKVLFLGGPLYFLKGLQKRFKETLKLSDENAVFPDLGPYAVAIGTSIFAQKQEKLYTYDDFITRITQASDDADRTEHLEPLFKNKTEYEEFRARHAKATVERRDIAGYDGGAYLGIDCGSTTTKVVLLSEDDQILYEYYSSNQGNPVSIVKEQLEKIYQLCGDHIVIKGSAVTGYGEDLIKNAFNVDAGLVETMAHLRAARFFSPNVDFILDIGGQDIKCFKVKNNCIDSIMLNEACSSGCGSFIETFAKSMGYDIATFAKLGLFSQYPVDLGSRCTVFMNSSVKQAQKDGATVEDISAGLSMSVVKNAIYKVIRARSADELGKELVVQGGTFLNDGVLRSFEKELGHNVIRPEIAGLMGAFGAALFAKSLHKDVSSMLKPGDLRHFEHTARGTICQGCTNKCNLTINTFSGGRRFISGNRCERPLGQKAAQKLPNLFEYKLERIKALQSPKGTRGKIGLPLGLNMIENIPFWFTFFTELGFEVVLSDISSRQLYLSGQYSIPSDTACYPAKLMHGHMENLISKGVDMIFYPCMSYNFDEKTSDNHFNCPVVAYYPELLYGNMEKLHHIKFLFPYLGLHNRTYFNRSIHNFINKEICVIPYGEIRRASGLAYKAYAKWQEDVRAQGKKALQYAKAHHLKTIVLAGRPYHIDPEINHGIDRLISSFGIVVVSEDAVAHLVEPQKVHVLNQWTYHARLYNSAKYVTTQKDMELIQLVSFGCGIDAITTDEVRAILESGGKMYTQLKIDEINNLGAVKIRIRSLLEAMDERSRMENE